MNTDILEDGIALVIRRYEGQVTDEVDSEGRPVRVTLRSFARHIGIPMATLRGWIERSIADDVRPDG
jgi:hypothetical protein